MDSYGLRAAALVLVAEPWLAMALSVVAGDNTVCYDQRGNMPRYGCSDHVRILKSSQTTLRVVRDGGNKDRLPTDMRSHDVTSYDHHNETCAIRFNHPARCNLVDGYRQLDRDDAVCVQCMYVCGWWVPMLPLAASDRLSICCLRLHSGTPCCTWLNSRSSLILPDRTFAWS